MPPKDFKFRVMLANIVASSWDDSDFLTSLQRNPVRVLNEFGLHPPPELKLSVHVDTLTLKHINGDPQWINKFGEAFMSKLNTSPNEALASIGYELKENVDYKIVFNSSNLMNIIIPLRPAFNECAIEKIR